LLRRRRRLRDALPQRTLAVGVELADGGRGYRVERVEPPPNPQAFGHAWVAQVK
jgi:hypothetical protein